MKKNFVKMHNALSALLLVALVAFFTSCEDKKDEGSTTQKFDPTKDVVISDFVPKSGGVGEQVVILGSNFGDDVSKVSVFFGGKKAVVVSCTNEAIYCLVPSKAMSANNELKVVITDGTVEKEIVLETERDEDGNPIQGKDFGFEYSRAMVVGTLCGYKNERDDQDWNAGVKGMPFRGEDGRFESGVAGFRNNGVMQFSPYNHDHLYVVYDKEPHWGEPQHAIQLIDLKNEMVYDVLPTSKFGGGLRLRTIDFVVDPFAYTADGTRIEFQGAAYHTYSELDAKNVEHVYYDELVLDEEGQIVKDENGENVTNKIELAADQKRWKEHLIVAVDEGAGQSGENFPAIYIVNRTLQTGDFDPQSESTLLASFKANNGAYQHPVNKEVYFNSYSSGVILRLDMETYWKFVETGIKWDASATKNWVTNAGGSHAFKNLFKVQDSSFEMQIDIHPTGDYAYIVVINRDYILRTDYDWDKKEFTTPYVVCGQLGQAGFVDGVGQTAKLNRPYQGTFVKNEQYEAEGRDDIYDFYFCDSKNHCVRYLTPEGIVRTYAGGGGKQGGADGTYPDGKAEGSENGELLNVARFDYCTGLVNDVRKDKITGQNTLFFYILDCNNCRIRTIAMESDDDDDEPTTPEGGDNGGNEE